MLTQAEYDALPDEVKDSDTIFFISDAPFENSNVVTLTKAQYDALSDATKMDGRFYYVTDEEEVAKSLVVQENVNSTETVPSSAVLYAETNSIKEWTTLPTVTGTTAVAIPSTANEVNAVVKVGTLNEYIPIRLTKADFTSSARNYMSGNYYNATSYSRVAISVSQWSVSIVSVMSGGTDRTSTSQMIVSYR